MGEKKGDKYGKVYVNSTVQEGSYLESFTLPREVLKDAKEREKKYIYMVEEAEGDDVFKYLLLMDSASIEAYIAQTRLQAEQSFKLSKYVAVIGFVLLSTGIALGIVSSYTGGVGLDAAYLTAISGILTEFISGVFFYLYNRTLQQFNIFHDKMLMSKQVIMSFLSNSLIADDEKRQETQAELSKLLMSSSVKTQID